MSTSGETSSCDDAIKVYLRVRPQDASDSSEPCLRVADPTTLTLACRPEPRSFTFDHVANVQTTQEEVFAAVAKKIIESCVAGYNGTIFAYGQTGSGKTFTMLGPPDESDAFTHRLRGIIPRTFDYLFSLVSREQQKHGDMVNFLLKCSFLEIYNEHVYDLLDNTSTVLNLRENMKRGVFVDNLTEKNVSNGKEAYEVLTSSWMNRRVAATSMNRESSRSHAVFTIAIESKRKETRGGVANIRTSQLNLVDLAGSERQRDTRAVGVRLKEAGSINKSLSALGNVIMSLVGVAHGKQRYVPYRDSKLTFLLRDSLGGNAKTFIIANVHPGSKCFGETLSTLNFARRAKMIRNKAVINEDTMGNINQLQAEVKRLKEELALLKTGTSLTPASVTMAADPHNEDRKSAEEYKVLLVSALRARAKAEHSKKRTDDEVKRLMELCNKKDKFIQSNKMILKFREAHINDLQKALKKEGTVDLEAETVVLLKKQIVELEKKISFHPDVVRLNILNEQLKRDLKELKSNNADDVEAELNHAREYSFQLEKQLFPHLQGKELSSSSNGNKASLKELESLRERIKQLEGEVEKAQVAEETRRQKQVELEAQLAAVRQTNAELEETVVALKLKASVELSAFSDRHMKTIKTMMTPGKDAESKRKRHSLMQSLSLSFSLPEDASLEDEAPPEDFERVEREEVEKEKENNDVDQDEEEMDPAACQEALTDELRSLQEAKEEVDQRVSDLERVVRKLKEENSRLNHQLRDTKQMLDSEKASHKSVVKEFELKVETLRGEVVTVGKQRDAYLSDIENLRSLLASKDQDEMESQKIVELELYSKADNLSKAQAEILRLEVELQTARLECEKATESEEALQSEIDMARQEIAFHEDRADTFEKSAKKEQETVQQLKNELDIAKSKLDWEIEQNARLVAQLKEGGEKEKELSHAAEENSSLRKELSEIGNRHERLGREMRETKERLSCLEGENANLRKTVHEDKVSMESLMSSLQEMKKSKSESEECVASLRDELAELDQRKVSLETEVAEQSQVAEQLQDEVKSLASQRDQEWTPALVELEMLREDNSHLCDENEKLTLAMDEQGSEIAKLRNASERKEEEKNELRSKVSALEERLSSSQIEFESRLKEVQAQASAASSQDLLQTIREQEGEILRVRKKESELVLRIENLEKIRMERNEEMHALHSQVDEMQTLRSKVEELEHSNGGLTCQIERIKEEAAEAVVIHAQKVKEAELNAERAHAGFVSANQIKESVTEQNLLLQERINELSSQLKESKQVETDYCEKLERMRDLEAKTFDEKEALASQLEKVLEEKERVEKDYKVLEIQHRKVSDENARLTGHQNSNQRIKYHMDLKKENNKLKDEIKRLNERLYYHKTRVKELQAAVDFHDKTTATSPSPSRAKENLSPS
ncbi:kinesin-like protein KIF15 [Oscarella lobularis]|uniref:kinesin-like protein KIF15 n=1 Tax=Oscarella lobularis TaxID=121494 RepID=UPI003313DAAF